MRAVTINCEFSSMPRLSRGSMAYTIVEESNASIREGSAGRAWFEGFMTHHPKLTKGSPQPLSHCRALSSNNDTITDFFGKLGAIYGRLNLISKPMQICNCDKSGVTVGRIG